MVAVKLATVGFAMAGEMHDTAEVHATASRGEDAYVSAYAFVGAYATIGDRTVIGVVVPYGFLDEWVGGFRPRWPWVEEEPGGLARA